MLSANTEKKIVRVAELAARRTAILAELETIHVEIVSLFGSDAPAAHEPIGEKGVKGKRGVKEKKGVRGEEGGAGEATAAKPVKENTRERVLKWHGKGKDSAWIAMKLGVSPAAVCYHLKNAGLSGNGAAKSKGVAAKGAEQKAEKKQKDAPGQHLSGDGIIHIPPLSEEQYDALREAMQDKEFMSARYALVNKVSPREVNHAVRSTSYNDYLDQRVEHN